MTAIPAPGSILVYVGGERIGDAMYKLPFVHHLRRSFPAARITWLAGKGQTSYAHEAAPLVAGLIDEVLDEAQIGRRIGELVRPAPLAGRRFDLIIDTQRLVLTTLILRRIGHRRFLSGAADFLFSDIRPPHWPRGARKPRSVAACLRILAELATGRAMAPAVSVAVDAATEAEAGRLLPPGPVHVGFAPGAGGQHKCWPLERFIAVARLQAAAGRVPVFLLGPGEAAWIEPVRAALPEALLPLQSAQGEVTPMLTVALGRRLAAAVANDSGVGHMLAAADVPLVSLFGPTPAEKFAPAVSRPAVLRAQDWGGEAMALIPVAAVAEAVERLVRGPD